MDIDTTKPNPGRIYDYYLGGNHNFDVDRATAAQLLSLMPSAKSGALLNRWFLYDVVQRLASAGFTCYLDFATGLPTQGYIHEQVPNARVLYTDIDPVTVAYGRTIIGENPNVRFLNTNVADVDNVLQAAHEHFRGERKIAVCFVGSTYFFDDPALRQILGKLRSWCAPGSQLAISWLAGDVNEFVNSEFAARYRRMGAAIFPREIPDLHSLLEGWKLLEPGLLPLNQWNGVEEWRIPGGTEEEPLDLYGTIVERI